MTLRAAFGLFAVATGFVILLGGALVLDAWPSLLRARIFEAGYWDFRTQSYHALAMVWGTGVVALTALLLAVPLGLGAAICLSEFLTGRPRAIAKITIELLAGIPSVVYGLIGVAFLLPLLNPWVMHWGGDSGDTLLAGGMLLAVMILPTIVTFGDDALRSVPRSLREQGLGLGLSQMQVILSVVVPHARQGLVGAVLLALGRAVGETIAVFLVVGRSDRPLTWDTLSLDSLILAGQTLTSKLGGSELAIAYGDPSHWQALMALGLVLWGIVAGLGLVGEKLGGRTT